MTVLSVHYIADDGTEFLGISYQTFRGFRLEIVDNARDHYLEHQRRIALGMASTPMVSAIPHTANTP